MGEVFDSIMTGLQKGIDDAKDSGPRLSRRNVTVVPVKNYSPAEIKNIRNSIGMSQHVFAWYLGISVKTVEAWEAGTNHPSGAAGRLLSMMEMDPQLTEKYPFVNTI